MILLFWTIINEDPDKICTSSRLKKKLIYCRLVFRAKFYLGLRRFSQTWVKSENHTCQRTSEDGYQTLGRIAAPKTPSIPPSSAQLSLFPSFSPMHQTPDLQSPLTRPSLQIRNNNIIQIHGSNNSTTLQCYPANHRKQFKNSRNTLSMCKMDIR